MAKSKKTFTIATLLLITSLLAVLCAFPVLLPAFLFALFWTFLFGMALMFLLFPLLAIVALSSPAAEGHLDLGRNKSLKGLLWFCAFLLLVFYLCSAGSFVLTHMTGAEVIYKPSNYEPSNTYRLD